MSQTETTAGRPVVLDGFASLAERYDALICDLWGVLHDGVVAFPHALDCLEQLHSRGTRIVILSNAPRRAAEVEARMNELGIAPRFYDKVQSSGEDTWQHLAKRPDAFYRDLGRRCFHFGPDRDRGMREGLDLDFVEELEAADFVLNTGAHMAEDTIDTYGKELEAAAALGLPMICANPDLEVIRGGNREICAGALAAHYEALGAPVRYHGKPHRSIYETCFAALPDVPRERIAAVGDSLRTDIAGAQGAGIDGVLVAGGIHAESLGIREGDMPDAEKLARLFAADEQQPVATLPVFRW
ncbi:TIGR01459 family HAD-type hydrolase [Aquibaculum arenosum]|uniref:TIGR01459 family HAD-type hydrolase n=1 Tax=Aquibaculum arenosum TaxID=3032591 RepID=A0ABT5YLE3_9PROT|nr:TIGR01459 family HAD-type hydrolase [Fodinicurvata sp. CAU 1616]MDF2095776.1 TIGR01459 family HAD-type hydrolase [Fodinicurvata sp. CAU 1616]